MNILFIVATAFAALPLNSSSLQKYQVTRCNAENDCQSRIEIKQIDSALFEKLLKNSKNARVVNYIQDFGNHAIDVKEISLSDGRTVKINRKFGQVISDCKSGGEEEFFTECSELITE
jgi:hypothetical protein